MSTALRQHQTEPLRLHFYTVALRAPATPLQAARTASQLADMTGLTDAMMERIRARAHDLQLDESVRLTGDAQALAQKGIFFMQAPARFADAVRGLDGIKSVDTPLNKRKTHPRRVSK